MIEPKQVSCADVEHRCSAVLVTQMPFRLHMKIQCPSQQPILSVVRCVFLVCCRCCYCFQLILMGFFCTIPFIRLKWGKMGHSKWYFIWFNSKEIYSFDLIWLMLMIHIIKCSDFFSHANVYKWHNYFQINSTYITHYANLALSNGNWYFYNFFFIQIKSNQSNMQTEWENCVTFL